MVVRWLCEGNWLAKESMMTIRGYGGRKSENEREEKKKWDFAHEYGEKEKTKKKRKVKGKHGGDCRDICL